MSGMNSMVNSIRTREEYENGRNQEFNLSNVNETAREYQPSKVDQELAQDIMEDDNQLVGSLLKKNSNQKPSINSNNRSRRTNTWGNFDSSQASAFNRYMQELYPSFENYKRTRSFTALKHKVRQFELISEQVYQN